MKLLALLLRFIAALLRLLPCKRRVVLMSRQSSKMSLDYRYLKDELEKQLGADAVEMCLSEPETKDKSSFVFGTLRQLKYACTSKVVVADGYIPAVCIPPHRKDTTVIQVWHALGAIKKFGYQALDTPAGRTSASAEAACMHKNYDLLVSAGPGAVPAYAEAFGYPQAAFVSTGLPRMDYLLDPSPASTRRNRCKQIIAEHPVLKNGKRNIVYAPTLRKGEGYENWTDEYLEQLASNCAVDDVNLIYTGHPLDNEESSPVEQRYACLNILPGVSTIDLLEVADVVITDYSAIAFEAGLLGKNVCFFVPDIQRYEASPGLNVDLLGGEAGFASADAAAVMAVALGSNELATEYFQAFRAFSEAYFDGIDFGSTQRVASLIEKALKE